MTEIETKAQLLANAGYSYNFERELYLNRKLKKALSVVFIKDSSEKEIEKAIQEPSIGRWRFFFIGSTPEVESELTRLLG